MAVVGTIRAQGTLAGFSWGKREIDLVWTFTNGTQVDEIVALTGTPSSVAIEIGSRVVILTPPPDNAVAWAYSTDGATFQAADPVLPVILTTDGTGGTLHLQTTGGALGLSHVQI